MAPLVVAGVDGCPGGWLVVRVRTGRRLHLLGATVAPTFADVIAATTGCTAVGVDIPIGLSETEYWREADLAAKAVLGRRRNSVFAAPLRQVLDTETHPQACAISHGICGKKPSLQAFHIRLKIKEANEALTPALQQRIAEVHPEVSFWAMNSRQPMRFPKKKPGGREERLKVLGQHFDGDLASLRPPPGAGPNDFLDACAAAWSAARLARRQEQRLPPTPPVDGRGLRMEIVY